MIKLHEDSKKYVVETFNMYTEDIYHDGMIVNSPIIHMYPTHDTTNEEGQLNGYLLTLYFAKYMYSILPKEKSMYLKLKMQ